METIIDYVQRKLDSFEDDSLLLNNKRGRVFGVLTVLERVSDFAVTLWILIHTFSGTISIGRFLLYNNSIDNLKDNLVSIFSQLSFLYKNSAMIELIRDFFELEPEDTNEDGIVVDKINSIKIEGVSYRYQGKKEYALKEINLEIKPGELTIFMGNKAVVDVAGDLAPVDAHVEALALEPAQRHDDGGGAAGEDLNDHPGGDVGEQTLQADRILHDLAAGVGQERDNGAAGRALQDRARQARSAHGAVGAHDHDVVNL